MVFITAEIGINHNGDMDITKKLIDISVIAGCDVVKFQKRNPNVCVPELQKGVMRKTPWGEMS
jgi:N-acetylneuraminate synthase